MTARLLTASKRMVVVDFEIDMRDGKWDCLEKEGRQKSLLIKKMHNIKKVEHCKEPDHHQYLSSSKKSASTRMIDYDLGLT